jgi:serine phosphatase RsbU (regulator of sigma subunit)
VRILFAGAKSPIYYVKDKVFGKLDPTRRGIGGFGYKSSAIPFANKELLLAKGDALYMTTDGYVDAGSEDRKPLSKQKFVETIQEIWTKPMQEQREIFLDILIKHQGKTAQRDDITVMGFRI